MILFCKHHLDLVERTNGQYTSLSKEERKASKKRAVRKKKKTDKPLKPREYARGSAKRKVKKLVRGTSKR